MVKNMVVRTILFAIVLAAFLSPSPVRAIQPNPPPAADDGYEFDWDSFDQSAQALQSKQAHDAVQGLCAQKQPKLQPGEVGVVYALIGGKCTGNLAVGK